VTTQAEIHFTRLTPAAASPSKHLQVNKLFIALPSYNINNTMAPHEEDEDMIDDEINEPTCEPYTTLGIEKTATADEIKSAYRKAALKHHPGLALFQSALALQTLSFEADCHIQFLFISTRLSQQLTALPADKAPPNLKDSATLKFQELAFAYAVLGDPVRRKRYDATGSTSESLEADGDFSWAEFYRSQYADIVTPAAVSQFSQIYKNSDEEKDDVLAAYEKFKGSWEKLYQVVMLSDPLKDEDRFRGYIDEAIREGEVKAYKAYSEETEKQREARIERARKLAEREEKEANADAEKSAKAKKGGKKKDEGGLDSLAAMIRSKHATQSSFLDNLEAKYREEEKKSKSKGRKGKKRASEVAEEDDGMPSEEAFQAAAARLKGATKADGKAGEGRKAKKAKR
jgi:DnaJ family protein C protein 9